MAEINDFDGNALFAQGHRQRRENERGRHVTGEKGLLQFRKAVEADRLEEVVAGHVLIDEIGDRAGEMAGDGDETDAEFLVGGHVGFVA